MKKPLAALSALALAALAVLIAPTPAIASGHLHGTVVDSGTNAPIGNGVIVFIQPGSKYYAYTDASGQYDLPALPDGTYHVKFSAPGYAPEFWQDSFDLAGATAIEVTDGADLQLDAALDAGATIHGTITDELGDGLQNARVWFYTGNDDWADDDVANVLTDASGAYSYSSLAPGSYKVLVFTANNRPDLASEWFDDELTLDDATIVELASQGSEQVDAQLEVGAAVEGTVTNTIGSPLSSIGVTAGSSASYFGGHDFTSGTGGYAMEGLSSVEYELTTDDMLDFFVPQTKTATLTAADPTVADFVLLPRIPDVTEFEQPVQLVSGPTTVTAGKTYEWTVAPSEDSDVYAILYSDPVFLGAAAQQNGEATLTLTIPAATDPGTHLLTFSSYEDDPEGQPGSPAREYLEIQVLAAPLAATGSEPAVPLTIALLALLAGAGALVVQRRLAR